MESFVPIGLLTALFCLGIGLWLVVVLCRHNTRVVSTYYRYDKIKGHMVRTPDNVELRVMGKFNLLKDKGKEIWTEGTPLEVLVDKTYKSGIALSDRGSIIASSIICLITGAGLIYLCIKLMTII